MNTWHTPRLIILARGLPEEGVLGACKWSEDVGPQFEDNSCGWGWGDCSGCLAVNNS